MAELVGNGLYGLISDLVPYPVNADDDLVVEYTVPLRGSGMRILRLLREIESSR